MLRIGIIGNSDRLDRSIDLIESSENCQFIGAHSTDDILALDDMMDHTDAFYVMDPILNADKAEHLVKHQKHCLIESPFAANSRAANYFINLVREADVKIQVSNPDRYNDAFHNTSSFFETPVFIESHRLQTYSKETKDLSLMMNGMIHDIDIILNVVKSPVKKVTANGVAVVSKEADIINARIEFDNGCIANLTASRINPVSDHKINFYQTSNFINVDYLNKQSQVFDLEGKISEQERSELNKVFTFDGAKKEGLNEFQFFADDVLNNNAPISMVNCLTALEIAYTIEDKVDPLRHL